MSGDLANDQSEEKELFSLRKRVRQLERDVEDGRRSHNHDIREYDLRIAALEGQIEIYDKTIERLLGVRATINPAK